MAQQNPNPHAIAVGDRVEICPYPKAHKVSYQQLGRLDGSSAKLLGLAQYGSEQLARVKVTSKDTEKNGTWCVPIKCLKRIST